MTGRSRTWLRALAIVAAALTVVVLALGTVVAVRVRGVLGGPRSCSRRSDRAASVPIAAERRPVVVAPGSAHTTSRSRRVAVRSGRPRARRQARIEVALLPLLRGEIVVTEVRLMSPVLATSSAASTVAGTSARRRCTKRRRGRAKHRDRRRAGDRHRFGAGPERALVYRDHAIPGVGGSRSAAATRCCAGAARVYRATFNAQALGGAGDNLDGTMVVPRGEAPATSRCTCATDSAARACRDRCDAARLDAVRGVARRQRGRDARRGTAARVAAVASVGALVLDADDAGLQAAGGWVAKPVGRPLNVDLGLRAGGFGLAVDRATVSSGDLRLVANPAAATPVAPDEGQQPLLLALEGVDAERIAAWMPAVAELKPRGALFLEGRVTPEGTARPTFARRRASSRSTRRAAR